MRVSNKYTFRFYASFYILSLPLIGSGATVYDLYKRVLYVYCLSKYTYILLQCISMYVDCVGLP